VGEVSPAQMRLLLQHAEEEERWREAEESLSFPPPSPALAPAHLLEFIRLGFPGYLVGWFHVELCRHMEWFTREIAAGNSPRLMISVPPRHGKSEIVSRRWPVWHLGLHPTHEVVVASYGQDLANDMSRDARSVRREALGLFPHLAPGDKDGVELWRVDAGGSYNAVGAGGPLTGRGAHALVIDDPFKNSEEADSEVIRESRWNWYTRTAYTRLAPGGGVLVMATRWHEDDLSGRLLKAQDEGGDQWRIVSYPAIAEEDEAHRQAGEALHPERYDLASLEQTRRVVGARAWASLFQQRPTPEEGGLLQREWMRQRYSFDPQRPTFGDNAGRWDEVLVSVDATFKKTKTADHVSIQAFGSKGPRLYLLDEVCAQMGYVDTRAALRDFVTKWRPSVILVEDRANGSAIIDELHGEFPAVVGFNPQPHGDKEVRAHRAAPRWEAGDVWLPSPEHCPWIGDYIEELCAFPQGKYDDRVDAMTQLLIWLGQRSTGSAADYTQAAQRLLAAFGA